MNTRVHWLALSVWLSLALASCAADTAPERAGGAGGSAHAASSPSPLRRGEAPWGGLPIDPDGDGTPRIGTPVGSCVGNPAVCAMPFIAGGGLHTVGLQDGGPVWIWGDNTYGQLGNGTLVPSTRPVRAQGLTGATAVAAGFAHTVALKGDGTVWAWGLGTSGQLGNGSNGNSSLPVQVLDLIGAVAVAGGSMHTAALRSDGAILTWGDNTNGQLGDGMPGDRDTPVQVETSTGLTSAIAVAAGGFHNVALKSDGTVWTWGSNFFGQLGDGMPGDRDTPVQVETSTGLPSAIAVAAGSYHTVALKGDGTVWTWGLNASGQLGNGTTMNSATPVRVSRLSGVIAVAANDFRTLALTSDGAVWAWGENSSGALGNGTTTNSVQPVRVIGLGGVVAVAGGYTCSMALKSDGTVWTWGDNSVGQLGNGTTNDSLTPQRVERLSLARDAGHTMPACNAMTGLCRAGMRVDIH